MNRKIYHVTKGQDGEWKGKAVGAARASVSGDRKEDVVRRTAEIAKAQPLGQVVIHKENGVIQSERTYGDDPVRYKS